ncbi:Glycosylphosphatidylinositol:protein transamidase, GAA1 component [Polychaeton citri CBS 116435]|uniref:Glycosylphosphatidylinositol:protein transamidase, GAA1 component n=1 Tax=Polychaeton citri CBS 116435 TaxID=1314669 RepID=A0A9P4QD44_9PEZI|nr:Glycosylphosphatidylinositol:protein transamidase, GAA1 component [Polychaeton citri CBS 116435]
MPLATRLLALRNSPVLLKLPPYLSALCVAIGIGWLLLLPLNEYSRQTYISENAILPGQVHTYFGGSEHNVFRAYRQEVWHLAEKHSGDERRDGLKKVLAESGLKVAEQQYSYDVAGERIEGVNVYGLLKGPRADATEAMVLMAAWKSLDGVVNYSGVALALTLARYFSRWSIWSKDIILLIPADSYYGAQAWVEGYHTTDIEATSSKNISRLPIKAGALQAAVAIDYPVGPWGHRFDKIDVLYDGLNGALPNLDLLNTAISVAGNQGLGCSLHGITKHSDSYTDRLRTLAAGVVTQSIGQATGPHSAFMPYHVDAITLKTVGDGWHDEMTLGRMTESLFRSINNLLEHLHQSFFFYILLNAHRFVSIGNYLPAAMLVSGSFTITALALWVQSGRGPVGTTTAKGPTTKNKESEKRPDGILRMVQQGGDIALVPASAMSISERHIFLPATVLLLIHLLGLVPLHFLTHLNRASLAYTFYSILVSTVLLPPTLSFMMLRQLKASSQQIEILQSFSLLLLGATLATLATVNFSLSLAIGLSATPLPFLRPIQLPRHDSTTATLDAVTKYAVSAISVVAQLASCPPLLLWAASQYWQENLTDVLVEMARGWVAQGVWTSFVFWCVLLPAWMVGSVTMWSGIMASRGA